MSHLLGEKSVDVMIYVALNEPEVIDGLFHFAPIQARWNALCAKWGEKAVWAKLDELERRGYLEGGVSLRTGQLTEKGIEKLREFAESSAQSPDGADEDRPGAKGGAQAGEGDADRQPVADVVDARLV